MLTRISVLKYFNEVILTVSSDRSNQSRLVSILTTVKHTPLIAMESPNLMLGKSVVTTKEYPLRVADPR